MLVVQTKQIDSGTFGLSKSSKGMVRRKFMNKIIVALVFFIFTTGCLADSAPLQIKDFKFNVSEKDFMAANKASKNAERPGAAKCKNNNDKTEADRLCSGAMILANEAVTADFYFFNDKLGFMKFKFVGDKMERVLNAFIEKFGPPTSTDLSPKAYSWQKTDLSLFLINGRYETQIIFFSNSYSAEQKRRKQQIVKQDAKGL